MPPKNPPSTKGNKSTSTDPKLKSTSTDTKGNKSTSTSQTEEPKKLTSLRSASTSQARDPKEYEGTIYPTMQVRCAAAGRPKGFPFNISHPTCYADVQAVAASPSAKNRVLNDGLTHLEQIVQYVDGKLYLIETNMTKSDDAESHQRNVARYLRTMLSVAATTAELQAKAPSHDMEDFFEEEPKTYEMGMDLTKSFPPTGRTGQR